MIGLLNYWDRFLEIIVFPSWQVDIVMRFDESRLDDFTGFFVVDSASNRFLNLTLINARGTLHGLVTGHNSSQAIQVKIFFLQFLLSTWFIWFSWLPLYALYVFTSFITSMLGYVWFPVINQKPNVLVPRQFFNTKMANLDSLWQLIVWL